MNPEGRGSSPDHISVVMPTYNGTRFVGDALASVFAQTLLPHEIIVVDDASTDGTVAMIRDLATRSPCPLRLIPLGRNCGGPAQPLNIGVRSASTELVALLEQDDLMAPERLVKANATARRHPECAIVIGRPALVTGSSSELQWSDAIPPPEDIPQFRIHRDVESFVIPSDVAFRSLMRSNFIYSNSNVVLRRSAFLRAGGFDARWRMNSDADLEFRILTTSSIAVTNSVVCGYRHRPDSLYHSRQNESRLDGLLIRLKWGSQRQDWAGDETERVFWALRRELTQLIGKRQAKLSLKVLLNLAMNEITWRRIRAKVISP